MMLVFPKAVHVDRGQQGGYLQELVRQHQTAYLSVPAAMVTLCATKWLIYPSFGFLKKVLVQFCFAGKTGKSGPSLSKVKF